MEPNLNMKPLCKGIPITNDRIICYNQKTFEGRSHVTESGPIHSTNSAGTFLGTKGAEVNKQICPCPTDLGTKHKTKQKGSKKLRIA